MLKYRIKPVYFVNCTFQRTSQNTGRKEGKPELIDCKHRARNGGGPYLLRSSTAICIRKHIVALWVPYEATDVVTIAHGIAGRMDG
jgi:hypothetical protein